ncbi:hypothetical protein [Leptospira sp. GIMC2001]|uniref:hypothetical protein n=1 Tax=Leptospira sp. GIMC2001 TaxID=1513297 RepID=UPI00234AFF46|nr:hypothetical protein [Leptospira sp. GIMC2001]WCL48954.1 hypothetical protein O4O04_16900 [Leptospira sp. GIMC2001]
MFSFCRSSFLIVLLCSQLIWNCSKSLEKSLDDWIQVTEKADSISMDELARLCFKHSYRLSEWGADKNTLYVEYGGASALTFSSKETYIPSILLDLARKAYRTYATGSKKGLAELRVSLVKPYYVKNETNPETEIQEFEVYRISIDPVIWSKVNSDKPIDPFETDENDIPIGKFLERLEILMKEWKVELNELKRVQVQ